MAGHFATDKLFGPHIEKSVFQYCSYLIVQFLQKSLRKLNFDDVI